MFKKKTKVEKFIEDLTRSSYEFAYRRPFYVGNSDDELSYEEGMEYVEAALKEIHKNDVVRKIEIDYLGFTDGSDNVDYLLNKITISPLESTQSIIFGKKINNIDDIKKFLNSCTYEYDFLENIMLSSKMLELLKDYKIEISLLDGTIRSFKEKFDEQYEIIEAGIKRNNYPCVGYDFTYFICNPEDVLYNFSIILDFVKKFKEYLLEKNILVQDIMTSIDSIDELDIIKTNKSLLAQAIAYNRKVCKYLTLKEKIGDFNIKDIILESFKYNPKCYLYIAKEWKKTSEVYCAVIDYDISLLNEIIAVNEIDEKAIKDAIKKMIE